MQNDELALTQLLKRHEAFWNWEEVDQPLIGWARWPRDPIRDLDLGLPHEQGELLPDMIDVERLLPQFEARFASASGPLDGDFIWPSLPTRVLPWLEAVVGARVYYSNTSTSRSIFTEPFVRSWRDMPQVGQLDESPWLLKLKEFVGALARLSGGRFAIAIPSPHGPWDVLGAVRSLTDLYLDLHDSPGALVACAAQYADLWVRVNRLLEAIVPRWKGGYVGFFGLWAPGFAPTGTDDTSVSVSRAAYDKLMLPADRVTAAPWRHYLFHAHSGGAHLLESTIDFLGDGRALQVVLDPNGPSLRDMLPMLRRIQESRVPLHVHAYSWADIDTLRSHLSPTGLALSCGVIGGRSPA